MTALSMGVVLALPAAAQASSHREAPFVTKNPKVDGTDFYMFDSYEANRTGFVTVIADYQPFQDAFGGPNYFELDPDALYEIHIDNTGDGVEDLTFQFQFQHALAPSTVDGGAAGLSLSIGYADGGSAQTVAVPFINLGDVSMGANVNVKETYTVGVVAGPRRGSAPVAVKNASTQATTFTMPTDNIGVKSFPGGYAAYAAQYVYSVTIPNCATPGKMFVGQRAEPFAVNLGPIFDLVDAPRNVIINGKTAPQVVPNPLAKKNITSLELEIPATCLQQSASQTVIGGWTSASLRQARVLNPGATYTVPSVEGGAWTQVSRLGTPLVNEVVIGLPDKDHWNSSEPKDDAQFAKYVTNPTLPAVIDVLFGPGLAPQLFPRTDLVEAFLTGVPGVNAFPTTDAGPQPATCEELRLNTAIPPTPANTQVYLGAAGCFVAGKLNTSAPGCDPAGFPNGRRPGDDVVDIALDVMEGYLIGDMTIAPASGIYFTDGVQQIASQFDATFPYLKTPTAGANGDGT